MERKRAIYVGDMIFNECDVFEFDEVTQEYVMINDTDFRYPKEEVEEYESADWVIAVVSGEGEDEEINLV